MIISVREALYKQDRQLLFGSLAIGTGLLVSGLVVFSPGALIPSAAVSVLLLLWVSLKYLETIGLPLLIFIAYTFLSNVLEHFHGVPSFLMPFALLMLGVLFVRWKFYGEPVQDWQHVLILIGGYGFIGFMSLLYAADPGRSQAALYEYAKNTLLLLVVVLLLRRPGTFRNVIWTLLAAGIFLGTITVYQQLTGTFENDYWGFGQTQWKNVVDRIHDYSAAGSLGSPLWYAMILVVLVPLALDRFWHEQKWGLRLLAACALVVCFLAIIFTYSRGGFLALCFVLFIMFVRRPPRPIVLLASLLLLLALLQFLPANYTARMRTVFDLAPGSGQDVRNESSFRGRASENIVAWQIFVDHPILGVGLNNYKHFYQEYSRPLGLDSRRRENSAHNLYLQIAAETGLIGLLSFGAIVCFALRGTQQTHQLLKSAGREDAADMVWAFLVGLSGYLVGSLFLHGAYAQYLWLLLGIALALPQLMKQPAELTDRPVVTEHTF